MSTTAVQPQVTARILDLLNVARDALRQAQYEGSHYVRQDPAPAVGSPWTTPDLPVDIARELAQAIGVLDSVREHAGLDYERANGIVHMRYAD